MTNTIQKSIWQNGLDNIRQFARDKHLTRTQNTHLKGMKHMYWKKNCGEAFNRWRRYNITKAKHERDTDRKITQKLNRDHEKHVNAVKDWTAIRGLEFLRKRDLANLWRAWLNVTQWKKTINYASDVFKEDIALFHKKRTLVKWSTRLHTTRKVRTAMSRFNEFKRKTLKKLVMKGLSQRNKENRTLSLVLSHVASKFDKQYLHKSFDLIRAFSHDKRETLSKDKVIASENFAAILDKHYAVRMNRYLGDMRSRAVEEHKKYLGVKSCLTHWYAMRLRDAFNKFKYQAGKMATVDDVNTEGPVVP